MYLGFHVQHHEVMCSQGAEFEFIASTPLTFDTQYTAGLVFKFIRKVLLSVLDIV